MGIVRVGFAALIALVLSMVVVAPASAGHDTYGVAEYGDGENLLSVFETPLALPGSQGTAPLDRQAGPGEDVASPGFRKLDQDPVVVRKDEIAKGSDLAFRGRLMISGSYDGIGLFERSARSLEQISFHRCPAAQGDVTVSGDYAFVSIDSPGSNSRESNTCNNTPTDVSDSSFEKEGLRIVDISNPNKPTQAGFIETECGSHTQTLVPGEQMKLHLRPVLPADR